MCTDKKIHLKIVNLHRMIDNKSKNKYYLTLDHNVFQVIQMQ